MKTMIKILIMILAVSIGSQQFVAAATATVTMTFTQGSGVPAAGQQVTCYITPPKTTAYPPKPSYTYLTANANGVAVWQPTLVDGATEYKCYHQTALTPDNCYAWGSDATTGNMSLADGAAQTFTFAATTPSSTTCKTTQQTESQVTQQQTTSSRSSSAASQSHVVAVPKITSVTVNGKIVAVSDKLELTVGQTLVVNGTTTPGGKVIVTVHSDPVETPVTADDSGVWRFDLASLTNLPAGDHSIDAVAVDADGVKSVATSSIAFTLKPAVVTSTAKTTQSKSSGSKSYAPLVVSLLLFLSAVAMIVWGMRLRRKSSHASSVSTDPKSAEAAKHDAIS